MLKMKNSQQLILIIVTLMLLNFSNYLMENSQAINAKNNNPEINTTKEILTKTNSDENNNLSHSRNFIASNKFE